MAALASPDGCIIQWPCGVVCIEQNWVAMENVGATDIDRWNRADWFGPGTDPRLACNVTVGGRAFNSGTDAIQHWDPKPVKRDDNPLQDRLVARNSSHNFGRRA